jgi:hypothetical protein
VSSLESVAEASLVWMLGSVLKQAPQAIRHVSTQAIKNSNKKTLKKQKKVFSGPTRQVNGLAKWSVPTERSKKMLRVRSLAWQTNILFILHILCILL